MKKSIFYSIFVIILSLVLNSNTATAQKNKLRSKVFINRTNIIIKYAKEAVLQNKVYTGDLNKATLHQKLAREYYKQGKFKTAAFQSHRARTFAYQSLKANKASDKVPMNLTDDEQDLVKDIPIAAQLDAEVEIPTGTNDETAAAERDEDVN